MQQCCGNLCGGNLNGGRRRPPQQLQYSNNNVSEKDSLASSGAEIRRNFLRMTFVFSIGHGSATTPLVYASSLMDEDVAYIGNSILYIFMMISALVTAVPLIATVGPRDGLLYGMALYAIYAAGFSAAVMTTSVTWQGVFFFTGSMCAGIGAGLLWAAEGIFMSRSAEIIAEEHQEVRQAVNAELAATFAFWYLFFEEVAKIMFSGLMNLGFSAQVTAVFYVLLAAGSTIAVSWLQSLNVVEDQKPMFSKITGAVRLWQDLRIWLLSLTNITFGLVSSYMNGYFNAQITSKAIGEENIGYCTAFCVLVAYALSKVYGYLGQHVGIFWPICIGALSFLCIPILILGVEMSDVSWGWNVLIIYALQGSGRSVYESSNKAAFADTYTGEDSQAAFANCALQMGSSAALGFFASAIFPSSALDKFMLPTVLIFAMITPFAYLIKIRLDSLRSPEASPLIHQSA